MTTPIQHSSSSSPSLPQFHEPSHYHAFINLFRHLVTQYETHACIYYQGNRSTSFHCLTFGQVDHISTNLACHWAPFLPANGGGHNNHMPVGFLADHSVDYFICFLAILKLRIPFLALSPRNSNVAIAHLLEKSKARFLLSSKKYDLKATDACDLVNKQQCNDGNTLIISHQLFSTLDLEELLEDPLHRDASSIVNTRFTQEDEDMPVLYTHRFAAWRAMVCYETFLSCCLCILVQGPHPFPSLLSIQINGSC